MLRESISDMGTADQERDNPDWLTQNDACFARGWLPSTRRHLFFLGAFVLEEEKKREREGGGLSRICQLQLCIVKLEMMTRWIWGIFKILVVRISSPIPSPSEEFNYWLETIKEDQEAQRENIPGWDKGNSKPTLMFNCSLWWKVWYNKCPKVIYKTKWNIL